MEHLVGRYMDYFIGSISHFDNKKVLFVPFEELCTREDQYMKIIGNFLDGEPYKKREGASRFDEVSGNSVDVRKVNEFEKHLSNELQEEILERTRLASPFFMNVSERLRLGSLWSDKLVNIDRILEHFALPRTGLDVDGEYFEPMTYLLRYPDLLEHEVNPVEHYQGWGKREGRRCH